uniref:Uncharacterized protein n=1 Tax=Opuntia streptacantha TaxID=393608 RepID=A0A7C9CMT4_OPUST
MHMLFKLWKYCGSGHLVSLSPEGATLSESSTPSCWLAQNRLAITTDYDSLRVAEHSCYIEASLAFNIHEEGVGGLNETLELVLLLLKLSRWVQQVNIVLQNHPGRR